jgi:hypothetical protein
VQDEVEVGATRIDAEQGDARRDRGADGGRRRAVRAVVQESGTDDERKQVDDGCQPEQDARDDRPVAFETEHSAGEEHDERVDLSLSEDHCRERVLEGEQPQQCAIDGREALAPDAFGDPNDRDCGEREEADVDETERDVRAAPRRKRGQRGEQHRDDRRVHLLASADGRFGTHERFAADEQVGRVPIRPEILNERRHGREQG